MRAKNFPRLCPCVPVLHRSGVVLLGDNPLPIIRPKGSRHSHPFPLLARGVLIWFTSLATTLEAAERSRPTP